MTNATLRTTLASLLTNQLGTYTRPNGSTTPAIWVGDPPSDWIASGVEVRIGASGEYANELLHAHTNVNVEHPVRVVAHKTGDAQAVVTRICQRFETTNPISIPPSEALGILAQYTLLIRS